MPLQRFDCSDMIAVIQFKIMQIILQRLVTHERNEIKQLRLQIMLLDPLPDPYAARHGLQVRVIPHIAKTMNSLFRNIKTKIMRLG